MLYSEIIAVCSQIHTKHINTLCGQNVELLNVKLAVHKIRSGSVPITLAIRSKSCAMWGRTNTWIVCCNPTRNMYVCACVCVCVCVCARASVFVLSCVDMDLALCRSPFQSVLPVLCWKRSEDVIRKEEWGEFTLDVKSAEVLIYFMCFLGEKCAYWIVFVSLKRCYNLYRWMYFIQIVILSVDPEFNESDDEV